ncbi:PepSY-associated TM helix domain-containing protein [Aneurinibacillus danicus]|jgi:hypothetical protein|uniref:PepSY domain-containing protein n=1 Tax=Aneurinibacillus danicus TaxID=267746 RepID=A0A511V731_9BACL|nr:PepSY-associated TM helix domain-containing protein [Aneurinibacillus danicus]GEN33533.1 hypothetical protein ADA01nite_09930 [Aneurinibacillus danicus]
MKKRRQLHLWIGLLTSFFILIEAITGLLLSEPWLIGMDKGERRPGMEQRASFSTREKGSLPSQSTNQSESVLSQAGKPGAISPEEDRGGFGLMGFIRGLHEGRIGGTNVKILVDITAIGLIILTVTGITLSIQIVRAQSRRKKTIKGVQDKVV